MYSTSKVGLRLLCVGAMLRLDENLFGEEPQVILDGAKACR